MEFLLSVLALLAAAGAWVLALVAMRRSRQAAERQDGFVAEVEQIAAAQRRVLEQLHGLAQKQRSLAEHVKDERVAGAREVQDGGDEDQLDPQAVKEDILFLAQQGLSPETIARDLGVPRGEVELILDLERFGRKD